MTVAAIIISPEPGAALADADGEPAIRRLAQSAWAGGALPVVVVAAAEPAGAPVTLENAAGGVPVVRAVPLPEEPRGVAWFVRGLTDASAAVSAVSGGLLWPFRFAWVDPETVTSLVEAHGATPDAIVRPAYGGQPGFPVLVPIAFRDRLAAMSELHGEEAIERLVAGGAAERIVELGDPGIVHDITTARSALPGYQGPPEPAAGPPPDWNAALGAAADAGAEHAAEPVEGPGLAPFGQAASPDPDEPA